MSPIDGFIILAVLGIGALVARKRLSAPLAETADPNAGAETARINADIAVSNDTIRAANADSAVLRQQLADAQRAARVAEDNARVARELLQAAQSNGDAARAATLSAQLDAARAENARHLAEVSAISAAQVEQQRRIAEQQTALAQRAIELAPRRSELQRLIGTKTSAVAAADVLFGIGLQQRRPLLDQLPEYREILGYVADDVQVTVPYQRVKRTILRNTPEGLAVDSARTGGFVPNNTGGFTYARDPAAYPDVILVTEPMQRMAARINDLSTSLRQTRDHKEQLASEIPTLQRELDGINLQLTGNASGIRTSGAKAKSPPAVNGDKGSAPPAANGVLTFTIIRPS